MEKQPQLENKEKLEQFEQELQAGIDFIQSLKMLVEIGELSEEESKQAQIVFEDFESWDEVKDTQELKDMISQLLAEQTEPVEQYQMTGSDDVGNIEVTIFLTNQEGVNLTKFKYQDKTVVWALQPKDFIKL